MTIEETQDEIIDNFSLFEDDLEGKLNYLMDLGNKLPVLAENLHIDQFVVKGCQSKVWLVPKFENGRVYFEADSNTAITKGLVSLLVKVWNNRTPQEISESNLYFIEKIGMGRMIGSQRSNGFSSMIREMKLFAASCMNQQP